MNVKSFFFNFYLFFLANTKKKSPHAMKPVNFYPRPLKIAVSSLIEHADFFWKYRCRRIDRLKP